MVYPKHHKSSIPFPPTPPPASANSTPIDVRPFGNNTVNPYYAEVIESLFTAEECDFLVRLAESTPGETFGTPAEINLGSGIYAVEKEVRDCGRIMRDDAETADWIFQRVKCFLEASKVLEVEGRQPPFPTLAAGVRGKWRAVGLNERLRFLKYGKEQYFRPHMDGSYIRPDRSERSLVTIQIYLAPDSPLNKGGETTFFDMGMNSKKEWEVAPKQGSVLLFQHRDLMHEGATLVSGEKITVRSDIMYAPVPKEDEESKK